MWLKLKLSENNLKILRVKADLTQDQLAEKVNVSRQTINSIENNRYIPSLILALQLSKFFNCKIEDIFNIGDWLDW